jgi:N,N'-diacetyllegionaminate synthase
MINNIKIIAEIGWNHMGDISLARKMIKSASDNGADICKFQTWKTENLKSGPWDNDGRRQIYDRAQLKKKDYKILIKECKKNKVEFLTSIFNSKDINFIKNLDLNSIKIPSHEIFNLDLILLAIKKFNTIYLSLGAARESEIKKIFKLVKKREFNRKNIILMHCVSSYPLVDENVNLPKLEYINKFTKNIGYSGHTKDINDAIAAISKGAKIVEKHFTINRNLPGRDNKNAILPKDLLELKKFRDSYQKMSINRGYGLQKCEEDIFKNYRGRWSK